MENAKKQNVRFKVLVVAESATSDLLEGNNKFDRVVDSFLGTAEDLNAFYEKVGQIMDLVDEKDKFYNYERTQYAANSKTKEWKAIATHGAAVDIRDSFRTLEEEVLDIVK